MASIVADGHRRDDAARTTDAKRFGCETITRHQNYLLLLLVLLYIIKNFILISDVLYNRDV